MYPKRYYKWGARVGEGGSTYLLGSSYRIAPVAVGQAPHAFYGNIAQMQMAKKVEAQKIDDMTQMWSDFT